MSARRPKRAHFPDEEPEFENSMWDRKLYKEVVHFYPDETETRDSYRPFQREYMREVDRLRIRS